MADFLGVNGSDQKLVKMGEVLRDCIKKADRSDLP